MPKKHVTIKKINGQAAVVTKTAGCALLSLVLILFLGACATQQAQSSLSTDSQPLVQKSQVSSPAIEAETHIMAGEWALYHRQNNAAAAHYTAAAYYSNNVVLAQLAAQIAFSGSNPQVMYQAAGVWAELAPETLEAQQAAAHLALMQGDAEALDVYSRRVLELSPDRREGYQILADVLSGNNAQREMALDLLDDLTAEDAEHAASWYAQGLVALRYGANETADQAAHKSVELDEEWPNAILLLAAVHIQKGQPEQAQALVEDLSGSRDRRSQYHTILARLLLSKGDAEPAINELAKAVRLKPEAADLRMELAVTALTAGQLRIAQTHLEDLYEHQQKTDAAAYYLGTLYERKDELEQARSWYEKVGEGDYALEAKIRSYQLLAEMGELGTAHDKMQSLRRQNPSQVARIDAAEGQVLYQAGEYEKALALYNESLKEHSRDEDLLYGRSLIYIELEQFNLAKEDLEAALEVNPTSTKVLNGLGYFLLNHGSDYQRAQQYINKAFAQAPNDPAILDSMGWLQHRLDNNEQALKYLEQAYAAYPDAEVAAHLGAVLWELGEQDRAQSVWEAARTDRKSKQLIDPIMHKYTRP